MIGIDLIKISRMEKFIEKYGSKALQRFLSEDEIEFIKSAQSAAGFWATKEAASKALGVGIGKDCSFFDIKISKTPKGAPELLFSKRIVEKFQIQSASLSITHDGEYAISVVAVESSAANKIKQF